MTETVFPMPQYKCRKVVGALKIEFVEHVFEEGDQPTNRIVLSFEDESVPKQEEDISSKPVPDAGWYYVRYEDGYTSFSPAEQFEDGYTLIEPEHEETLLEHLTYLHKECCASLNRKKKQLRELKKAIEFVEQHPELSSDLTNLGHVV